MTDDGAAWDLSKENIQPLKTGRRMGALSCALTAEGTGPAAAAVREAREAAMK